MLEFFRPGSPPSNRPLDYDQYDLGEDQNLILYGYELAVIFLNFFPAKTVKNRLVPKNI